MVVLAGTGLSIAVFGLRDNLDYLSALSVMSRHGEVYYPNQSFNGLVNRLLGHGDSMTWMEYALAPYHPVVHAATLISLAALVLPALLYRRRDQKFGVVDVLIAATTFTGASPVAWQHHYGVLAPAFPVLALLVLEIRDSSSRQRLMGVLALAYLFCSRCWISTQVFAFTWANVLQSYLFLASLVVLWLLYRLRGQAVGRLATQGATGDLDLGGSLASGPGAPVARTALTQGIDGGARHAAFGRSRRLQR